MPNNQCFFKNKRILYTFLLVFLLTTAAIIGFLYCRKTNVEIRNIRSWGSSAQLDKLASLLDRSMALIPAGEFTMGSNEHGEDERPRHRVYLDTFMLDRYEVTNTQYQRFIVATEKISPRYWSGRDFPDGQADYPVVGVSWEDASSYCRWVGKRLPTEAEWEKACRGPEEGIYPWGNDWDPNRANVGLPQVRSWPESLEDGWQLLQIEGDQSGFPSLRPVGSYPQGASYYEVYDLAGNASEWVVDWYNWDGYWDLPLIDPIGSGPPWNHCLRGSGWFDRNGQDEEVSDLSRCSARNSSHSDDDPRLGFRCAQ